MTITEPSGELRDEALDALRGGEFDEIVPAKLQDEEYISRLMWALTHLEREQARINALCDSDRARLAEQHASEMAVLEDRRSDMLAGVTPRIEDMTKVVTDWHRAVYTDSEDRGEKKQPTTKAFPAGALKSRAGSTKVNITDMDTLVAWCKTNGHDDIIKVKETVGAREMKDRFYDAHTERFVAADGDIIPGISAEVSDRSFSVALGGGS